MVLKLQGHQNHWGGGVKPRLLGSTPTVSDSVSGWSPNKFPGDAGASGLGTTPRTAEVEG